MNKGAKRRVLPIYHQQQNGADDDAMAVLMSLPCAALKAARRIHPSQRVRMAT